MMCLRPLSVNVLAEFYDGPSMNKNDLISLINEIDSYITTACAAKRQKKVLRRIPWTDLLSFVS
jgi:hypothetical protein